MSFDVPGMMGDSPNPRRSLSTRREAKLLTKPVINVATDQMATPVARTILAP
jgi:hypothetical protein